MKKIIGAAIGSCVHVAGLYHFLKLAETEGYHTDLLGPAIPVHQLVKAVVTEKPTIVAVSYRLTPGVARTLFDELKNELNKAGLARQRMIFGGTPPVAAVAAESGLFERVFNGEESTGEIINYLSGGTGREEDSQHAQDLVGRIRQKYPYPLLRHHFGRPSLKDTIAGVAAIAGARVLDVISLGTDQNAQEFFFRQDEMDRSQDGAGGVPVRNPDDLRAIYDASRTGNYPLLRCYSGTRDLLQWARMSVETIHNAWAAIPLCWYSVIDGRSDRSLVDAITENQQTMKWYARQNIPVEVNESHQWSLRDAHDSLAVTMAFLAAYNAKKTGVRHYVSQFMMNTPPSTTPQMDIAKMMAKKTLIEELEDESFTMYREVRAGIPHFSSNPSVAKGQLAASATMALFLHPHIYHVVGFSEGDHASLPEELIESCEIVHGVLRNCLHGLPDISADQTILKRKEELISEARILLEAVREYGRSYSDDPWSDPVVLSSAIRHGLLDAPHFRGNAHLCGRIRTRSIHGAWYAVDENTGDPVYEAERTARLLKTIPRPGQ